MDGGKVMCPGGGRLGLGMVGLSNRDKMGRFLGMSGYIDK